MPGRSPRPDAVDHAMHEGVEDPAVFFFCGNWESADDLDAHLQAPHLQQSVQGMDDLLDGGLTGRHRGCSGSRRCPRR